jgi:hypothetical protein
MTRLLHSHNRDSLQAFLNQADADDAGEAALQQVYGFDLANLATQVLGPGEWQPRYPLWPEPPT